MPLSLSVLDIYGYEIENVTGRNPVLIAAKYVLEVSCPFCSSKDLRKKDKYIRKLNHEVLAHVKQGCT